MMSALVADGEFPDYLLCPVCFEIPEKEVYQCRDGHLLCGRCYTKLNECPQCREPLDKTKPIRSRLCEEILDKLKVDCVFKSNGCTKKLIRGQVVKHESGCCFDFKKFGSLINLCKLIGYTTCDFQINNGNANEAMRHFVIAHGSMLIDATTETFNLELDNIGEDFDSRKDCFWTPQILELKDKKCFLLIATLYNKLNNCVAFPLIFLPYKENLGRPTLPRLEYVLAYVTGKDNCLKLSFSNKAITLQEFVTLCPTKLPHQFESSFLTRHLTWEGGKVLITCKVLNKLQDPPRYNVIYICGIQRPSTTIWSSHEGSLPARNFLGQGASECRNSPNKIGFVRTLFDKFQIQAVNLLKNEEALKWMRNGALFVIAEHGTVEPLDYPLQQGLDLNIVNENQEGLLYFCVVYDQNKKNGLEKAKFLIGKGADVWVLSGSSNRSLLHFATIFGTVEFVELFLSKGLNPNATDSNGFTPLHTTMFNRKEEEVVRITQALLEHGANYKVKENGKTPMDMAMNKISKKTREKLQHLFCKFQNKNS